MMRILIFIFINFYFEATYAQKNIDYKDVSIESLIEQFIETNELEDYDVTDLLEILRDLEQSPIDINKANEAELTAIVFLSPLEISAILNHRETYGNFISIEELQTVNQLDINKIRLIIPFISVSSADYSRYNFKDILRSGSSTIFAKYKRVLQTKKGYKVNDDGETPYLGTPDHFFMRYRFDSGRAFKAGVTMEKDPGEEFFKGNNKSGFDFYSAYVYAENLKPWLKAVSIGDYTVSLGQGLILHNGFGGGKSVYTIDIKKDGAPFRPYSSVNETNYFRGISTTISPVKNLNITGFFSQKEVDGTFINDSTSIDDFGTINSLVRDGLHRTESEIAKKGTQTQTNFGGRIDYTYKKLRLGINHLDYQFSAPLKKKTEAYRLYTFSGDHFSATSFDYSLRFKNINTFGEYAISSNGGIAQIHSALIAMDKHLDIALSYRDYAPNYYSLEGNAFSEGSLPVNERGIYFGLESNINNNWKISSYMDLWQNPWLRFRVDAPGGGKEYLIRIDYIKKRKYNVYFQYRYETKNLNSSLNIEKTDPVIFTHSHRARLHFSYQLNKEIEFRSRVELSAFDKDGTRSYGHMVYQDIFYKPLSIPLSFNARVALFDTDGFDSRIYTYENDLLYEFYIPFYQRQGIRTYFNLKYKLTRKLGWEMKLARTILSNEESFSSGNEFIDSNRRTEFKTQLKYSF